MRLLRRLRSSARSQAVVVSGVDEQLTGSPEDVVGALGSHDGLDPKRRGCFWMVES